MKWHNNGKWEHTALGSVEVCENGLKWQQVALWMKWRLFNSSWCYIAF